MAAKLSDRFRSAEQRAQFFEFVRFCVVGVSSTLIYLGVYAACVSAGVPYGLASVAGWLVSVATGFLLHHHFTFRAGREERSGPFRWLALQTCVLLANFAGLSLLVHELGFTRIEAQVVLLPFIPLATFVLGRRFVFAQPRPVVDAATGGTVR